MLVAVERKEKGVSRIYGQVIDTASKKSHKKFIQAHINKDGQVRTDRWTGYKGLESEFPKLTRENQRKRERIFLNCTVVLWCLKLG